MEIEFRLGETDVIGWSLPLVKPKNNTTKSHTEEIKCPECNKEQTANVAHTLPWYSYVHECIECKYIIMESEWNKINLNR